MPLQFVKYNAVLRGLNSEVPFLRNQLVSLCCEPEVVTAYQGSAAMWHEATGTLPFAAIRSRINLYTTTIHAINSCVVKLSKLTVATKVYRGVSGRVLPPAFYTPNTYGVRGGIEGAFMSTTTDKGVAMARARVSNRRVCQAACLATASSPLPLHLLSTSSPLLGASLILCASLERLQLRPSPAPPRPSHPGRPTLAVSQAYAAGGGAGVVFEIQQGMIDRGADLSFISQYPHEKEILFAPLTGTLPPSTTSHHNP